MWRESQSVATADLCGHIHSPAIRQMGGITYYNCGDFVESCSAIVEHGDGRMELLTGLAVGIEAMPLLPDADELAAAAI